MSDNADNIRKFLQSYPRSSIDFISGQLKISTLDVERELRQMTDARETNGAWDTTGEDQYRAHERRMRSREQVSMMATIIASGVAQQKPGLEPAGVASRALTIAEELWAKLDAAFSRDL